MSKVIDISYHNGNIDFNKVKKVVDNVIIRCGFGDDVVSQDDKMFKPYIDNALKAGLNVGLYIYSYATTVKQASSEAEHILRLAMPYKDKISNVLWYDIEEANAKLNAKLLFETWAMKIGANGFKAGLYAGENYYNTSDLKSISGYNYPLWIAKYGTNNGNPQTKPNVPNISLWQYTSAGKIDGISGNVDISECYTDSIFTKKELTINEAIEILVERGVIATPEYWYNAVKVVKYLEPLLINMASTL